MKSLQDNLFLLNPKIQRNIIIGVGIATFFFGFGLGAILNLYLFSIHSPLVLQFKSSLKYISSIFGDGIILPIVNMIVVSSLFKNQEFVNRLTVRLGLFFGFLVTVFFHIIQASQGLVNWAMPSPWQWNFLGIWHAVYMFAVSSLLSLFYIILIIDFKRNRHIKEALVVSFGLILFFILLGLDYNG